MTIAVRVDNLGKRYRVPAAGRGQRSRYRTLREDLAALAAYPWRRWRRDTPVRGREDEFWALRDVGFEVKPGEVLGIVGRNGAGKSTLLKILSRITRPTVGHVDLWGRVGSLLEVGTGFHPELTGRENIYINGAILGMRRREIARKFDEIVAFAEVERFLDTPVKRYSSGMYVRLAFAVAAHLEPEILVVDEVLAVGDLAFQEKCMGRMREAGRDGRTVLFISHNMAAIESLCDRALLLDAGRVIADGGVAESLAAYRRQVMAAGDGVATLRGRPVFRSAALLAEDGEPTGFLPLGGDFHLRIGLETAGPIAFPTLNVAIHDPSGLCLLTLQTPLSRPAFTELAGPCEVDCRVAGFPLAPGEYWASLWLSASCGEIDAAEGAIGFRVVDGDAFGEGRGHRRGLCIAPSAWAVTRGRSPAPAPTP